MPNFNEIPEFVREGSYRIQTDWKYLESTLNNWKSRAIQENGKEVVLADALNLDPDFQRPFIWTPQQEIDYVEYILQGGRSGRELYFNNPTWMGKFSTVTELVDGKQRLNTARRFLANKIPAFGYLYKEWTGHMGNAFFYMNVNSLKTRKEVLQWYLGINSMGTPHTPEEIQKVRDMLKKA